MIGNDSDEICTGQCGYATFCRECMSQQEKNKRERELANLIKQEILLDFTCDEQALKYKNG